MSPFFIMGTKEIFSNLFEDRRRVEGLLYEGETTPESHMLARLRRVTIEMYVKSKLLTQVDFRLHMKSQSHGTMFF